MRETLTCRTCLKELPIKAFYERFDYKRKEYRQPCIECYAVIAERNRLKRFYGITSRDDLKTVCEICGTDKDSDKRKKYLCIDHDHKRQTKHIRGILCSKCNHMLGLAHDNKETLRNAIEYLERDEQRCN